MYCPHCGASVNNESRFCPECGGRLKDLGNTEIMPEEEMQFDDITGEPEPEPAPTPAPEVVEPAEESESEEQPLADVLLDLSQLDEDAPRRVVAEVVGDEPEKKNTWAKWVALAGALVVGTCICSILIIILLASMSPG